MGTTMKILNDQTFDSEFNATKKPTILYFYADWCGPCKSVSPLIEIISNEYGNALNVFKVNVDNSSDVSARYNIMSIPTLLFVDKDKSILKQTIGFTSKEEIIRNTELIVV